MGIVFNIFTKERQANLNELIESREKQLLNKKETTEFKLNMVGTSLNFSFCLRFGKRQETD